MGSLAHTVLVKTERMRGVEIDAERRIARVEAGVLWAEVSEAAAEHGLAALAGSSPDVGVVGCSRSAAGSAGLHVITGSQRTASPPSSR